MAAVRATTGRSALIVAQKLSEALVGHLLPEYDQLVSESLSSMERLPKSDTITANTIFAYHDKYRSGRHPSGPGACFKLSATAVPISNSSANERSGIASRSNSAKTCCDRNICSCLNKLNVKRDTPCGSFRVQLLDALIRGYNSIVGRTQRQWHPF